jgi:phenylalanyl-tRNA synthetase beta chain
MRFNLRWLLKLVDLDLPTQRILDGLTMAGLEVESYLDMGLMSGRIVVGEILEIHPHGTAKKLYVCKVRASADPKAEPLRIVCGAPGMKIGDKVPVALPGAVLHGGRTIEQTAVRGEMSEGMLCSGAELGWNNDAGVLLSLDPALPVGEPFDGLVEIAVTPNRPDCLSLVGIARDIAAYFRVPFHPQKFRCTETTEKTDMVAKVAVEDKDGCPRYTARVIRNVRVGPSPTWLARAVEAAGLRSINNVVDATNYVLMELGHPLHAFDLDKIASHEIIVRRAREGETLHTLDGVERPLIPDDLLITDPSRAIALAGIIGGENTEISDSTVNVLLESAYFDPIRVRKTRRRLDIQTDASFRFERGTDRENIHIPLNRCAQLIREVAGGELTRGFIDVAGPRPKAQAVTLRIARVNQILGAELDGSELADLLVRIGCEITHSDHHQLVALPPSHRVDLLREIDLIEEIGRLHGYDKIEATTPYVPARPSPFDPGQRVRELIGEALLAEGFSEVCTYSFTDRESLERSRQTTEGVVELLNPLSRGQSLLRTSLLPSVLATVAENHKHGSLDLAIYEVAKSYHWKGGTGDPYVERNYAVAALSGSRPAHWSERAAAWTFFDIKGIAECVLDRLGIRPDSISPSKRPEFHPGRSASFAKEGTDLCVFGQIHPEVSEAWDIRGDAFVAEFDLDALTLLFDARRTYQEIPQYPAVTRDLALLVDVGVAAGEIEATLRMAGGELLESLRLFDVYEGKQVPAGKRSLAYSLTFRAADRTLTDDKVNALLDHILATLAKRHGAQLRQT